MCYSFLGLIAMGAVMMQGNQVLSFFHPRNNGGDWSQKELAEFYRVEAALVNSGISLSTDRGLTDEGDPWFIFCRQDNDETIVHFARIDGEYVIFSNLSDGVVRGRNFNALVRELLDNHPYVLPKSNPRRQTVYLHPATLLAALIVTGYVKSAEMNSGPDDRYDDKGNGTFFNGHSLVAFSALVVAVACDTLVADSLHNLTDVGLFEDAGSSSDSGVHAAISHNADYSTIFDNLALQNADQLDLGASHFSARSAQALADNTPSDAADDGATTLAAQLSHAPAAHFHFNDSDPASGWLEISRADRDGYGLHSDAEQNKSMTFNNQMAAASSDQHSQPATTDLHGSSSPAPAVQTTMTSGAVTALSIVWNDLHMDPQALHPDVLAATTLSDAVQVTLSQFGTLSKLNVTGASTTNLHSATSLGTDKVGSGTTTLLSSAQLNNLLSDAQLQTHITDLLSSAEVYNFNSHAQHSLETFFNETPNYKIKSFGSNVLVVDTDPSHYSFSHLETWKMTDGTTLSILGQAVHSPAALAA